MLVAVACTHMAANETYNYLPATVLQPGKHWKVKSGLRPASSS